MSGHRAAYANGAAGLVLAGCLALAGPAFARTAYSPTQRTVNQGGYATATTGSGSTSRIGPATSGETVLPGRPGGPATDSINAAAEAARMGGHGEVSSAVGTGTAAGQ